MLSIDVMAVVNKIAERYQHSNQQKVLNAVILALYAVGGKNCETVSVPELTARGLTKFQVFEGTQIGIERGMIEDRTGVALRPLWGLTPKGLLYAEALVEEGER